MTGLEAGEVVVAPVGHRPREVGAVLQLEGEKGRGVIVTQSRQAQGGGQERHGWTVQGVTTLVTRVLPAGGYGAERTVRGATVTADGDRIRRAGFPGGSRPASARTDRGPLRPPASPRPPPRRRVCNALLLWGDSPGRPCVTIIPDRFRRIRRHAWAQAYRDLSSSPPPPWQAHFCSPPSPPPPGPAHPPTAAGRERGSPGTGRRRPGEGGAHTGGRRRRGARRPGVLRAAARRRISAPYPPHPARAGPGRQVHQAGAHAVPLHRPETQRAAEAGRPGQRRGRRAVRRRPSAVPGDRDRAGERP